MTIKYIKKDLTTVNHGIVAHGCNCQGKMGAGVAFDIRKKWPAAYYEYVDRVHASGRNRAALLGECQLVTIVDDTISYLAVANCFTQVYYGREAKRYADPAAIHKALKIAMECAYIRDVPLYMSRIGCSLGGLTWETDVEPLIVHLDNYFDRTIFVCDI